MPKSVSYARFNTLDTQYLVIGYTIDTYGSAAFNSL